MADRDTLIRINKKRGDSQEDAETNADAHIANQAAIKTMLADPEKALWVQHPTTGAWSKP